MKILLDTHILLWYLEDHANLTEAQRLMIEDSTLWKRPSIGDLRDASRVERLLAGIFG